MWDGERISIDKRCRVGEEMYNWVLECVLFLQLNKIMFGILEIDNIVF